MVQGQHLAAPYHATPWFFLCGPIALNTFVLGLALNVHVFQIKDVAFDRVLDMKRDEVPSARGLFQTAIVLFLVQSLLFQGEATRRGDAFGVDEMHMELLFLGYTFVVTALLVCPLDVLHYKFRMYVVRNVVRCLWPFQRFSLQLATHVTPFAEVFIADGMTSLSKFIQDLSIALLLFVLSWTSEPDKLRELYASKLKESPLPYFAASAPYIIRATQCLLSFQRTRSVNDRFLHLLNTMKYCSSLLVISVGAYPMLLGHAARPEQSSFFLLCAVFNSLYSFLWDVIMDWGLGQPKVPRRVAFLRHHLVYPRSVYYLIMVLDFMLRIMWVTKWWDWMPRGEHFKLVSQVAEVVRRILWNLIRVEWQCIKADVLASKKESADAGELAQSIEQLPLLNQGNDDVPRLRLLSRPSSFSAENSGNDESRTLTQSPSSSGELLVEVMPRAVDADIAVEEKARQKKGGASVAAVPVASYTGKPLATLISRRDVAASTDPSRASRPTQATLEVHEMEHGNDRYY
ncbi:hypothetical protein PsorP6_012777 [Peronosclerospora sorghi]|uniref:Uncharacterized protein n=1 Tax=Peronosclerospora sorghi TaxID=230839 RepID=A0ACC0WJ34_9STRA|nr:hypothetical protein PsorP6_012777 [Peronosclerospora sorghi]